MTKIVEIIKGSHGLFDIKVFGQVIGGGSMMEDEDDCYLERLDIDEAHRGQGYGTQALYALRDIFGTYYLAADNEGAHRLYSRVAWEMSSEDYNRFGFAIDQGYGVHIME